MAGLGRVNLLVGTNNCGKTSVLEAIHILAVPAQTGPLWQTLTRRGELSEVTDEREVEVAHVIHGHKIEEGSAFKIAGANDGDDRSLTATFVPRKATDLSRVLRRVQAEMFDGEVEEDGSFAPLSLQMDWKRSDEHRQLRVPVTRRGGLPLMARNPDVADDPTPVLFITTEGLTRSRVIDLFESTVLTPDENVVLEALRTIEPALERIAPIGTRRPRTAATRGGFVTMVDGQRIPIGSMGDGMWRLLGIALALVRVRGGILLVDEIDTGLHYSVLEKMWRLVFETAKRLDTQVFATTHSRDCYEALAAVTQRDRHEISIQRIERDKPEAIAFDEAEIQVAAERGLEVR